MPKNHAGFFVCYDRGVNRIVHGRCPGGRDEVFLGNASSRFSPVTHAAEVCEPANPTGGILRGGLFSQALEIDLAWDFSPPGWSFSRRSWF